MINYKTKGFSFMNRFTRLFLSLLTLLLVLPLSCFSAFCAEKTAYDKITSQDNIICISHRGNTAAYPENSLEAVTSAEKIGADLISVSVGKTSDGVLVLCDTAVPLSEIVNCSAEKVGDLTYSELSKLRLYDNTGAVSDCKIPTLEESLNSLDRSMLILDNAWDLRDEISAAVRKTGKENSVLLRTDVSSKKITEWTANNPGLSVIGIYKANIVFNAISHFNRLSDDGQPLIQYQSKNYFNVSFNSTVTRLFSGQKGSRAVAAMYDPDLCGQREDSSVGWSEMIDRGFSAIETNCIGSLVNYTDSRKKARETLVSLLDRAETIDASQFSAVSVKNFRAAYSKAQTVIADTRSSLSETEKAFSGLNESMNNLTFHSTGDVQKGNLNITPGKILAAALVGAAILAGEIYVYKMHKPRRKKEKGKTH